MHDLLPSFSFYITSSFIIIFLGSPIEASPQASLVRIAQEWSRVIIAKEKMSYDRYGRSVDRSSENRPPKKGKPFRHFVTGDLVDVQDHKDTWYEAEIKDVDCDDRGNIDRVLIHFFFWDNSYDEWYRPTSNKIAAHCSKIWTPGKRLRVGHRIDVFDTHPKQNKYLPCTVIEEDRHNILIHYASHSSHWDEWLPRRSGRIAPYGHRSKKKSRYPYDYDRIQEIHYASSRKSFRKRSSSSMDVSSLTRFKAKLETLEEVPLTVKNIRGDGNCLFRAISHQIYLLYWLRQYLCYIDIYI